MPSATLSDRVKTLFEGKLTASAGKLQMIGIESIRDRLGDRWERSRNQICASFERGLKNELLPGDVFFKVEELAYIILFNDRTVEESKLVCAKIAQDVCRKLFGEDESLVSVRSLTCEADQEFLLRDVDLEETLDALLEDNGEEQVFSREVNANRVLALHEESDPEQPIAFCGSSGMPVSSKLSDLKFSFSPVWDVERRVVLTYLCRASLDEPNTAAIQTSQFLLTENPDHQVLLDLAILRECARRLADLKENQRRVLMACPLHWATVSRARYWSEFRARFLSIGSEILQDLIICVHNIDAGTPNIRLMQEFPKLSGVRGIYGCLSYGDRAIDRFTNTRIGAIGFPLPDDISDERSVTTTAREFCVSADAKGFASLAFGVETRSLAMALIGTGFRFLEGSAIRPAVVNPRNAFVHETIDLFSKEFFG